MGQADGSAVDVGVADSEQVPVKNARAPLLAAAEYGVVLSAADGMYLWRMFGSSDCGLPGPCAAEATWPSSNSGDFDVMKPPSTYYRTQVLFLMPVPCKTDLATSPLPHLSTTRNTSVDDLHTTPA
jgi:hypothetical protein